MGRARRLLAVASALGLLALAPEPAEAATATFTDRLGDAIDARGDIVSWRLRHGAARVSLRVRARQGSDPFVARPWDGTNTAITWFLDTQPGRPGPEYRAVFRTDRVPTFRPYVVAVVRDLRTGQVGSRCAGTSMDEPTGGWFERPNIYELSTPRACIGNPARVRGWVRLTWDPHPRGGRQGNDRAPAAGMSSWVRVG